MPLTNWDRTASHSGVSTTTRMTFPNVKYSLEGTIVDVFML